MINVNEPPQLPARTKIPPFPWEEYLNVKDKGDQLAEFDGDYNIPQKEILEKEVKYLVAQSEIPDNDKASAIVTMTRIAIFYSKKTKKPYTIDNGWLQLLIPLIIMKHSESVIYNLFEAIRDKHIPFVENCEHIIRLLMQYHDPQLAHFIVRKRVSFRLFTMEWTQSLFADLCEHKVLVAIWKQLFRLQEPAIFYVILAILTKHRENILSLEDDNKDMITQYLSTLPQLLDIQDVHTIFSVAQIRKNGTPISFEYDFFSVTFGGNYYVVPDVLCLPVYIDELSMDNNRIISREPSKTIGFFIIDCRPIEQFNAGHLPQAINLDLNLHQKNPLEFANKIDELLELEKNVDVEGAEYFADKHFCFIGSNRDEDNFFVDAIVDPILNVGMKYVSILKHGYMAIHDAFKDDLKNNLIDHNKKKCLVCNPEGVVERPKKRVDLCIRFSRITGQCFGRRMSSLQSSSIDINTIELINFASENFQIISIDQCLKSLKIKHILDCMQIQNYEKEHESKIVITDSKIIVLRLVRHHKSMVYIISNRPLGDLIRITAPKNKPNLINLHYGTRDDKIITITETQKFIIANDTDAVNKIGKSVLRDMRKSLKRRLETIDETTF